jgi:hypothetical protein
MYNIYIGTHTRIMNGRTMIYQSPDELRYHKTFINLENRQSRAERSLSTPCLSGKTRAGNSKRLLQFWGVVSHVAKSQAGDF